MRVTAVLFVSLSIIISASGATFQSDEDTVFYPEDHDHHQHHHHHHHHVPFGDDSAEESYSDNATMSEIPIDFIKMLSNYSTSELLARFVEGEEAEEQIFLQDRFGERDAAVNPKPAGCMPEMQTVKLGEVEENSAVLFIPTCTRIERCGGCCTHSLLECQPTETETVNFQVYKTKYTGSRKLRFVEKQIVQIERHTKCKCDCKIKEEDCNVLQVYNKNGCRCVCRNKDEEKKCLKRNDIKIWNPDLCACQCREERPCSSGFFYDSNLCKCVSPPMRRRYVTEGPAEITPSVVPLKSKKIK